jgi:uncharacterized protein YhaN
MKLLRLDLLAYGPFTDVTLDLDGGHYGLHLLYGPNEAGKSSALRALRQLFYGIAERTPDDFLHRYDKLRIGAKLCHSDGTVLEFIRRKARVKSLRGPDDKTELDQRELSRFLGGVDQGLFETMFGIDHETLVRGGREILQGGGQLGQVLFAAGSGIADLRAVRESLQAETEELFTPGGKIKKINKAITDFREAQATVKHQQLSSDEWLLHDHALRTARETKERLEFERQQKSREQNRLTRIQNALHAIARRKELVAEWETYRDAVVLPDDFGEIRRETLTALRLAESQVQQAQQTLEQINQRLSQIDVPEALLEQAAKIEDLHRRLGEYQKDMKDRPQRYLQWKQLEHEAKDILESLGRPADLDQAEHLRLRTDEPVTIQNLGNRYQALVANWENARQSAARLSGQIDWTRRKLEGLPAPRDPADLRRSVRHAQQQGELDHELATAREALRQAEKQAAMELARLPLWSGTLETLETLPVPSSETVDRFDADIKDATSRRNALAERIREEERGIRDLEGQVRKLELQQEVPSEEDLADARKRRDAGWKLVRRAWQQPPENAHEVRDFLTAFESAGSLAEGYERSVQHADQVADRLRREADRVALKAGLLADRQKRSQQRDQLARQFSETESALERIQQHWSHLWQPLGICPLPPQEMRVWLRKQSDLVRQARDCRKQRDLVTQLRENIDAHKVQVGTCLQAVGEPAAGAEESLALLLERSQQALDRLDALQRQREEFQRDLTNYERQLRDAEAKAQHAEQELNLWRSQWAKLMARLGLEPDAEPAAANAFLNAITKLFQKLHEADGFRRRIEGMDRDARQFNADVQALAQLVAPDLTDQDAQQTVAELYTRLTRARGAQQEQQTLQRQRVQEMEKRDKAQTTVVETKIQLDALCQEARCTSFEDLPQAEQRSATRRQLEKDLGQLEEQLLTLSAGATLEEFVAEAAEVDADSLGLEIQRLSDEISTLEQEISQLDQTIGSERTTLEGMDGSAAAAEAAEQAENLLAQLQSDVQHYVTLRLAAGVLQRGIERYREKNQGSVLKRASVLFAHLTGASFEGLHMDYNDNNEAVLVGIRAGGKETVGVEGMSEGTGDQLYLALRLASLETYLDKNEPLPFIIDDILINFDNHRAIAALEVLAKLSERTQILFFTHHEHLIHLAEENLDPRLLFTHRLPGRQGSEPS